MTGKDNTRGDKTDRKRRPKYTRLGETTGRFRSAVSFGRLFQYCLFRLAVSFSWPSLLVSSCLSLLVTSSIVFRLAVSFGRLFQYCLPTVSSGLFLSSIFWLAVTFGLFLCITSGWLSLLAYLLLSIFPSDSSGRGSLPVSYSFA